MAVRGKRIDSLLGPVHVRRHYYHCRVCHQGCFPRDQRLGLAASHLTPAASEVASIAGVQTSFAQSSEITLQKMCGLHLSESTVERVTEAAGKRLARRLHEKVTFDADESWTSGMRRSISPSLAWSCIPMMRQSDNSALARGVIN